MRRILSAREEQSEEYQEKLTPTYQPIIPGRAKWYSFGRAAQCWIKPALPMTRISARNIKQDMEF